VSAPPQPQSQQPPHFRSASSPYAFQPTEFQQEAEMDL
jgi:hypothetical protein